MSSDPHHRVGNIFFSLVELENWYQVLEYMKVVVGVAGLKRKTFITTRGVRESLLFAVFSLRYVAYMAVYVFFKILQKQAIGRRSVLVRSVI